MAKTKALKTGELQLGEVLALHAESEKVIKENLDGDLRFDLYNLMKETLEHKKTLEKVNFETIQKHGKEVEKDEWKVDDDKLQDYQKEMDEVLIKVVKIKSRVSLKSLKSHKSENTFALFAVAE